MKKNLILTTLLIMLLKTTILETDFNQKVVEFCTGVDFSNSDTDGPERAKLREQNKVFFGMPYEDFKLIIGDKEWGKIAEPKLVVTLFLAAFFILFNLVMFFFLVFSFCCCNKTKKKSKEKCYFYTTLIFIVLFVICLILMLIYASKTMKNIEKIKCASATFPNDVINGKSTGEIQFIGFTDLISMLENFSDDLNQLNSLKDDFQTVVDLDIPQSTKDGLDSLPIYQNKFEDKQTSDGGGLLAEPLTVTNLEDTVEIIRKEFEFYDEIGKNFNDAANEGLKYDTSEEVDKTQAKIKEGVDIIKDVEAQIKELAIKFFDFIDIFSNATDKAYVSDVILASALFGFFFFIFIVLFCQTFKKSCLGCHIVIRILLIIVGLVSIGLSIVSLVLLIGSFSFGSSCNMFEHILISDDFNTIMKDLKLGSNDDKIGNIITQCVSPGNVGSLDDLVGTDIDFSDINVMLDGFTDFDKLKANFTNSGDTAYTIEETSNAYDKFKNGIFINQENAIQNLVALNKEIECNDEFLVFNKANCTDTSNDCKIISDMNSYTLPSCASPTFSNYFNNLKTYDDDNIKFVDDMLVQLKGPAQDTPNSRYIQIKDKTKDAFDSYDNIKTKLKDTIDFAEKFTLGFSKVANCRIVRREILLFEDAVCFGFNENLFYFYLFTFLFTMFLTMTILSICCTMKHANNKKAREYNKQTDHKNDKEFYIQDNI